MRETNMDDQLENILPLHTLQLIRPSKSSHVTNLGDCLPGAAMRTTFVSTIPNLTPILSLGLSLGWGWGLGCSSEVEL